MNEDATSPGTVTARQYFAAMIMASMSGVPATHLSDEELAKQAVKRADALIAELEK